MFSSVSSIGGASSFFFGSPTPVQAVPSSNNIVKKKRKKNKKKKPTSRQQTNDDDDDDEDDEFEIDEISASLDNSYENNVIVENNTYGNDPIISTIEEVLRKSHFERSKVHACVTQMWDAGLKYDDPDCVIEHLTIQEESESKYASQMEQFIGSTASLVIKDMPSTTTTTTTQQIKSHPIIPVETISSSISSYTHINEPRVAAAVDPVVAIPLNKHNTSAVVSKASEHKVASSSTSSHQISHAVHSSSSSSHETNNVNNHFQETSPSPSTTQIPSTSSVSASLASRLETAASHENLSEALTALCTWASIAGSTAALQDFFQGRALEIILNRVLSDRSDVLQSDIRTGLSTLLQHVLQLPTSSSTNAVITAVIASLESLIMQVQSSRPALQGGEHMHSFLTESLAHRIGMTIRKLHVVMSSIYGGGKESVNATLSRLDNALVEISTAIDRHADECALSLSSQQQQQQPVVLDLKNAFIQRELLHERLQLELEAAEALREAALLPRTTAATLATPPRLGGTIEDDVALESALFADAGESRGSIDSKKSQAQAARSYVDHVIQEHTSIMTSLREDIRGCINHINELQVHYDDLASQMQRIEREMTIANNRRASIQNRIVEEQNRYDTRISSLDGAQHGVISALRVEDSSHALLARVKDLENSLTAVVSSAQRPVAPPAEEYPVRVAAASEALGSYVESEARCISVLARRVSLVENRLLLLRREVEEYRALDMQNLGAEIEGTILKLSENAAEDMHALTALRAALTDAVKRFASCLTADLAGMGMVAMPSLALGKAVTCLLDAGVSIPPELKPFVPHPQATSTSTHSTYNSNHTQSMSKGMTMTGTMTGAISVMDGPPPGLDNVIPSPMKMTTTTTTTRSSATKSSSGSTAASSINSSSNMPLSRTSFHSNAQAPGSQGHGSGSGHGHGARAGTASTTTAPSSSSSQRTASSGKGSGDVRQPSTGQATKKTVGAPPGKKPTVPVPGVKPNNQPPVSSGSKTGGVRGAGQPPTNANANTNVNASVNVKKAAPVSNTTAPAVVPVPASSSSLPSSLPSSSLPSSTSTSTNQTSSSWKGWKIPTPIVSPVDIGINIDTVIVAVQEGMEVSSGVEEEKTDMTTTIQSDQSFLIPLSTTTANMVENNDDYNEQTSNSTELKQEEEDQASSSVAYETTMTDAVATNNDNDDDEQIVIDGDSGLKSNDNGKEEGDNDDDNNNDDDDEDDEDSSPLGRRTRRTRRES